jgi:hypothetical protein
MLYLTQLLKRTSDNKNIMYLGETGEVKDGKYQSIFMTEDLETYEGLSVYHQDDENPEIDYFCENPQDSPVLEDVGTFFATVDPKRAVEFYGEERLKKFISTGE